MTPARALRPSVRTAARRALRALAASTAIALLAACSAADVVRWTPEVIATHPHDANAFTQGLLFHDGRLFESTGRYGVSDVREVRLETGAVVRARALDARYFAEGLARVDDRLVQLTYREGTALVYDLDTFEEVARFTYEGEGWGLCHDGTELWMSDGSSRLQRRDPATFELLGHVDVRRDGRPVERLNELECVGEHVIANVWLTTELVRIVKADGRVDAVIDASALVPNDAALRANSDAVLNGVAHDPATGRWWLTGKLWPVLYEVRFVEKR